MTVVHVQTRREVQDLLTAAGLRPSRRLGQHFLIDGNLMRMIADSAEVGASDTVLEVGGGTGGLSDLLAGRAGHLVIVEVSARLAELLTRRFITLPERVTVICADVLASKHTIDPRVLATLDAHSTADGRCMLVANLPYQVATPLLLDLLVCKPVFERFCFTVQFEVAQRLVADGGRDFGPLSVAAQTLCKITRLANLPPSVFWPPPKVHSTLLRMDRLSDPPVDADSFPRFMQLVRAAFAHRRKTLRYNLNRHLNPDDLERAASILDLGKRAETVAIADWIRLAGELQWGTDGT